jgi:hypothetical protein
MSRYAKETTVSASKSRMEIEDTLSRYGATAFMYGHQGTQAVVAFEMAGRRIMFRLPMPARDDPEFTRTPARKTVRSPQQREAAYDQAVRQRWRALALVIKAKLEAVESGITEFENEFMAHIVLPGGQTVGEWMRPQIAQSYESGRMPPLLTGPEGRT